MYYLLTDKPNLHHIFPVDFITNHPGSNKLDVNSLMNIAYLPQITNLQIGNRNPIDYLRGYDRDGFEQVLAGHLIFPEILAWARQDSLPETGLDLFINQRVELVIAKLREKLSGIPFDVIDIRETESNAS